MRQQKYCFDRVVGPGVVPVDAGQNPMQHTLSVASVTLMATKLVPKFILWDHD